MKHIQMICTSEEDSIFITAFDPETNVIEFRSSREPKYLQEETVIIKEEYVYLNLHYFHIGYLKIFKS
jgi:hypothetical protein